MNNIPRKFVKISLFIISVSAAVAVSLVFLRISLDFPTRYSSQDIEFRLNWLTKRLSRLPSPKEMINSRHIEFTGEWGLVTYSMSAAALTNIAMDKPERSIEFSEQIARWIEWATSKSAYQFDEQAWGRSPLLDEVLNGDEGHIGYYGHLNFMLGCYALLNSDGRFQSLHLRVSEAIARRMNKYPHRHVETYPGQNYPPDNTVAVASLSIFDKAYENKYGVLIKEWIGQTKRIESGPYGIVPFQIDTVTGMPIQEARGSNNAWNSFFLTFIDEDYANIQYQRLLSMTRSALGFSGLREYARGHNFTADRDTGPVIFGLGASSTAFLVAGATRWNGHQLSRGLLRSIELLGCTTTRGILRHYATAPVVGEAIMLAMKTIRPWRKL
ncbi:MAG: hypothetical protein WAX79_05250 [Candidatus Omnitrophota bacterium]